MHFRWNLSLHPLHVRYLSLVATKAVHLPQADTLIHRGSTDSKFSDIDDDEEEMTDLSEGAFEVAGGGSPVAWLSVLHGSASPG